MLKYIHICYYSHFFKKGGAFVSNVLCSRNFKHFFNSIEKLGLPIEQLIAIINNEIKLIAPDINLGRLVCEFHFSMMSHIKLNKITEELYSAPQGFDESHKITKEFKTSDNGAVIFHASPVQEHKWNDIEEEDIEFLLKNLFVIFGRAHLADIIKTTVAIDAMTKLPNAVGFLTIGNRLAAQNKLCEYNAMFLNLKNFRCLNSQIGSKQGDRAITAYAEAVRAILKEDEYIARLGGDNFTLLVKKENCENVLAFLNEVMIDIELESTVMTFSISARIGMYKIAQGDAMHYVMDCIATAVSNARRNTSASIVEFTPDIMKRVAYEHKITNLFPAALKKHEFVIYYQPKVDLLESTICGCEALVRWNHDGRLIPPGDFIPIFERDGNICALDFYMLDSVCRDIESWIKQGIEPVTVSVNFSKTHLHNPDFAQDLMDIINKYDIDTKYIEVEMTEMSDFNDYEAFKQLVSTMKANGVVTSIDDFGTGYSSLNLLTDFMFDVVKLDKSFLDNITRTHSKTDEIVVRNIVKMIIELGMKVIAEGVETVEQALFLKSVECTMVQGYLYDRPLCKEDFVKRLVARDYKKLL